MLPTRLLRFLINSLLALVLFTAVGQIRIGERSLENRYHAFVNSDKFQAWFWAMAIPLTWTGDKLKEGLASLRNKFHSSTNAKESAR
jgi:membrane protein required for beta-lactamase induction